MKTNKLWLGILIGVLVSLIMGFSGFMIYNQVMDKNNNTDNGTSSLEEDGFSQEVTLDYTIEGTMPNVKILVNNQYVDLTGTNIEVIGKLNDILVIQVASFDLYSYYGIDQNARIVASFIGNGSSSENNANTIELRGNFPGTCVIENNSLVITSDVVASEPTYNSCSKNDDDIVEYTETFNYLGNGNFSDSILTSTMTAREYILNHNINCS